VTLGLRRVSYTIAGSVPTFLALFSPVLYQFDAYLTVVFAFCIANLQLTHKCNVLSNKKGQLNADLSSLVVSIFGLISNRRSTAETSFG
jgi:hypothetical protein